MGNLKAFFLKQSCPKTIDFEHLTSKSMTQCYRFLYEDVSAAFESHLFPCIKAVFSFSFS